MNGRGVVGQRLGLTREKAFACRLKIEVRQSYYTFVTGYSRRNRARIELLQYLFYDVRTWLMAGRQCAAVNRMVSVD